VDERIKKSRRLRKRQQPPPAHPPQSF